MKRIFFILLAVMVLSLGNSVSGQAAHGGWDGHGGRGWHGGWGWGADLWLGPWWGPWWGPYPYAYPYSYPYYSPPATIQSEPELTLQAQPETQHYWYFCKVSNAYYPYVKKCPGGWMKVVPSPTPPEEEK